MSAIAAAYGKHQLQERVNFFHFFLMGSASLEWNTWFSTVAFTVSNLCTPLLVYYNFRCIFISFGDKAISRNRVWLTKNKIQSLLFQCGILAFNFSNLIPLMQGCRLQQETLPYCVRRWFCNLSLHVIVQPHSIHQQYVSCWLAFQWFCDLRGSICNKFPIFHIMKLLDFKNVWN